MAQILALDYGSRRVGIAHTDDMQIIASPLCTLSPEQTLEFLKKYCFENAVCTLVVGKPSHLYDSTKEVDLEPEIRQFIEKIKTLLPLLEIDRYDERFTSKMASKALFEAGAKKSARKEKGLIDRTSATIILQSYMENLKRR